MEDFVDMENLVPDGACFAFKNFSCNHIQQLQILHVNQILQSNGDIVIQLFPLHLSFMQQNTIRATARLFCLDRQEVRAWLGRRADYDTETRQTTSFRVSREAIGQYSEMEVQLYDFI